MIVKGTYFQNSVEKPLVYGDVEIGTSGYDGALTVSKRLERLNIREEIRKVRQSK